jgi:hypothetical protein
VTRGIRLSVQCQSNPRGSRPSLSQICVQAGMAKSRRSESYEEDASGRVNDDLSGNLLRNRRAEGKPGDV